MSKTSNVPRLLKVTTFFMASAAFMQTSLAQEDLNGALQRGDYATAFPLALRLAESGNVSAERIVGKLYISGRGTAKNNAEAFRWLSKAAAAGDPIAEYTLGGMYLDGSAGATDPQLGVRWIGKAAEQKDLNAENFLGLAYYQGLGVEKDDLSAWQWLSAAAKQGSASAAFNLGALYEGDIEYREDDARVVDLFREIGGEEAATKASHRLNSYSGTAGRRTILTRSPKAALPWYRKAAEQDVAVAQVNLGNLYLRGEGIEQDGKAALHWFSLAASHVSKQGNSDIGSLLALFDLAVMYRHGWGVDKDAQQAAQLVHQAQAHGLLKLPAFEAANKTVSMLDTENGEVRMGTLTAKLGGSWRFQVR